MVTIAALLTSYSLAVALGVQSPPPAGTARMLFCAFGGVGIVPASPPPRYESEFAVAVVEINSPREEREIAVTDAARPNGEWEGVLPAGDVHLRIRVALPRAPGAVGGRCRVKLGLYAIDGPADAEWPT